jgi:hypothetical protein
VLAVVLWSRHLCQPCSDQVPCLPVCSYGSWYHVHDRQAHRYGSMAHCGSCCHQVKHCSTGQTCQTTQTGVLSGSSRSHLVLNLVTGTTWHHPCGSSICAGACSMAPVNSNTTCCCLATRQVLPSRTSTRPAGTPTIHLLNTVPSCWFLLTGCNATHTTQTCMLCALIPPAAQVGLGESLLSATQHRHLQQRPGPAGNCDC